jgi:hypothetical protein
MLGSVFRCDGNGVPAGSQRGRRNLHLTLDVDTLHLARNILTGSISCLIPIRQDGYLQADAPPSGGVEVKFNP